MKILHIISGLGSGGAQKLVEETVPLLDQLFNVQVQVLLLDDRNNVFDKKLKDKGIKIEVVPFRQPLSPLNIFFIKNYLAKGKFDVVHVHLFPTNYWVSLASKLLLKNKPKLIFTEHSTHNTRREKWYFKYLDRYIYSNYNKVVSISEQTHEKLLKWLNIDAKELMKYVVIENGVNIDRFKKAKSYRKGEISEYLKESNKLLCMVGRFAKQKDQATIIKSMKSLPAKTHLLLIGDGELKEENEKLAIAQGVENRVHFLGVRNDVDRILKSVDIVILSSHWEGFGLAAVEGMAAGKPVVASDVSGLREVVNGAGVLFKKGNSIDLADNINELLTNEDKYKYISSLCNKRAELYRIEKMVRVLYEEYLKS